MANYPECHWNGRISILRIGRTGCWGLYLVLRQPDVVGPNRARRPYPALGRTHSKKLHTHVHVKGY
jgi:hypothetical protein